jgi:hypothetical protein
MTKPYSIDNLQGKSLVPVTEYKYQSELTEKLDDLSKQKPAKNLTQNIVNEIVLWKVDRYAGLTSNALKLLNEIKPSARKRDDHLTRAILEELLQKDKNKGVGLPMASTLMRFRNPKIYQIIDRRAYRFLTGEDLKLPYSVPEQIELYSKYLKDLEKFSKKDFAHLDRILYLSDKELNGKIKPEST